MNFLLDGMFYSGHGFAEGNRILLRILDQAGYRVRIMPRDRESRELVLPSDEVAYITSFETTVLQSNDIYLCNWVGPNVRYNPEFRFNIARTTFESDRIPQEWVSELNKFDEVWVQCAFNKTTFTSSGVTAPLKQIPNFFDIHSFAPQGEALSLPVTQSFLFLSIFDMQERKGYDLLLRAFLNEFTAEEDTALILKIRDNTSTHKLESIVEAHHKLKKKRPAVYIIDQMLTTDDLLSLYRACHAFVLPTRGEGWGRPFFEAMLMELPVIGTNWSGQTEFMNRHNSYLIKVERLAHITNHENPMFNGHYWAEPSVEDLQAKMRYVFEHQAAAKKTGRLARKSLLHKYGMSKVAGRVMEEIGKFAREGIEE